MQRPDWVDDELYPFEDHYAEAGGCKVHYVDEGDGPPLLMLHGNPTWSFTWREVITGLRDRYRCIAPDLPGFGLSPMEEAPAGYGFTPPEHAEVIEAFVAGLDLREVTLLAQDWGGPIGFRAASQDPERYAAFAIGNTWAWPMTDNRGAKIFSKVLGGPLGRYLILKRNFFVEKIVPGGIKRGKPSQQVMDHYRGPFPTPESRVPIQVLPGQIIGATPWLAEVERGLRFVDDRPALILWPTRDQAFGDRERQRFEQAFDDHRTVLLDGAGHYVGEDAGEEIATALREWSGAPR
jgi:haloalkane dehalogenase